MLKLEDIPKEQMERLHTMMEQMKNPIPLHPELEMYHENLRGMDAIRHPLVFSIPHSQYLNGRYNKMLEQKKTALAEAIEEKNWDRVIFLHERPYRFEALYTHYHDIPVEEFWPLVRDVWVDSEFPSVNLKYWKFIFGLKIGDPRSFMNEEDRKVYDDLPNEITVYRGYGRALHKMGLSYTLDKKIAKWYSTRFSSSRTTGKITTVTVKKSMIFAYTNQRNEQEIIIPRTNRLVFS